MFLFLTQAADRFACCTSWLSYLSFSLSALAQPSNNKEVESAKAGNSNLSFQSNHNGVSKSMLRFSPGIEDDGRALTCRASNLALHSTTMEDQWSLQVHCKSN